jgi:dipeptidyl-peptidase-3
VTHSFVSQADGELLKQWKSAAFELQVGIHELLGHGSGKLFYQDGDDGFNFDRSELKHPLHEGQGISTWYKPGETWDGVFGSLSSAYEVRVCDDLRSVHTSHIKHHASGVPCRMHRRVLVR